MSPEQLPPDAPRSFELVDDPALRPRKNRVTVRVIVVDEGDRTLLLHDTDPGKPDTSWWVQPGGGMDPGETTAQTAVREVAEETGLVITEADLVGPIAERHVVHGYSDQVIEQDETFYLVRTQRFELDDAGFTEDEKLTIVGERWWSREELATTSEIIWPDNLLLLWDTADHADRWPLQLGAMEESTVPDVPPAGAESDRDLGDHVP